MNGDSTIDLQGITDPEQIRALSNDPNLGRNFDQPVSPGNRKRLAKMVRVFSVHGKRFPTMCPRADLERAASQNQLWSKLNVIAQEIESGAPELEPLAEWVRGKGDAEELGLLVQQSVGRLFVHDFVSTKKSWAAACVILEASRSSNVLKMTWWRITGKLERAKESLSAMVNGDLSAVNGIGVALHHIVDGLKKMRELAHDDNRAQLAIDDILDECLFAPDSTTRLAKADGESRGCPFRKGSLFVLKLGTASKGKAKRDLVFLSQSWSRCPADTWVPALLEGVWKRAMTDERAAPSLWSHPDE